MENTQDEKLKNVIQETRNILVKNGYTDNESIESWVGQSLYYLYHDNSISGFSSSSASSLNDVSKENVLNFLANNYVEKINETQTVDIRDEFQKIIKSKCELIGLDNAKKTLKSYVESGDTSLFDEENIEDVMKFKPDSLLLSMGIITAKNVLQDKSVEIVEDYSINEKRNSIPAFDLIILSNKNYDINKVVGLMEGIRNGNINNKQIEERV